MSLARQLLSAAIADREAFSAIAAANETAGFGGQLELVWRELGSWYEKDPQAAAADVDTLAALVAQNGQGPKKQRELAELVREVAATPTSGANVAELVRRIGLERAGHALAARLVSKSAPDDLREALLSYQQLLDAPVAGSETPEDDWRGLIQRRVDPAKKWKVSPKALNEALGGGVLPGHNITIFARPEVGKTALGITMACGFARRGRRVLYVCNEESVDDLRVRAMTNLLKKPAAALLDAPAANELEAIEKGASNLFFRELSPGTMPELERLVRDLRPQVLVVDQLRNLRVKTESYTQLLDRAAQFVRALGKRYGLVTISLTQAGDSARNKSVLDDGDIDSSNTGIPGAADVLIGMGCNDGLKQAGQRVLSLCKNKVSARHEHFTVYLDEPFSNVRS